MLASTMQFSRYGRSQNAQCRIRGKGVLALKGELSPVPSGPNSVPDQTITADQLPVPEDVLTGFADSLTQ